MATENCYTVASLFCGVGGLDLGFEYAGFSLVWANDISKNAVKSYSMNLGTEPVCGDIAEILIDDIPRTDVVIAGPPCQSFSLVGRRRPDDERGLFVFRFLDVVKAKLPRVFVMENVPGISCSRIGDKRLPDFLAEEFRKVGYNVNVLKLNASDYLIPQKRERVFIVGSTQGLIQAPQPVVFARECYGIDIRSFDLSASAAIGDLGPCTAKGQRATYRSEPHSVFAQLMRRQALDSVSLHECPRMSDTDRKMVCHIPPGGNYRDIPDHLAPGRVLAFKKTGGRTTTYGRLHPDRPAYTINAYFRRPNVGCNFHYAEPRLITPREAMRFQSLPDHFEICYGSQDERNAFIGNAVPALLAHAIAWATRICLDGSHASASIQGRLV